MCCIFESLALVKGDQKVKSRDAEEKKKLDRERASEREREAGPSLNAVRLKFHSVEERKGGQGIRRRKHEIEKE